MSETLCVATDWQQNGLRSTVMNLSRDCRKMLMPSARRKTPLKKAPSSFALCQPNERSCRALSFSEICVTVSCCGASCRCGDAHEVRSTHDLGHEGDDKADQVVQLRATVSILWPGAAALRTVSCSYIMEGISKECK